MSPVRSVRTTLLSTVAYAGMFLFGIVMALLGAVMPILSGQLSLTLADVGTLFLAMNAAMLAASLLLGLLVDRFGLKWPLTCGAALVAVALLLVATASRLADLLLAVVCLGLGGGALNGGTNTLVSDLHDEPRRKAAALNVLGVFFGFGALFLPFSIGVLLARWGLPALLMTTAGLGVVTALAILGLRFPAPKQLHGWPLARMPQFLRMPIVVTLAFLLFFQSGNEFVLGGYIATFLTRELTLSIQGASYTLAGYWAAIMLARVLLSRLLLRVDRHVLVLGSAMLSAASVLVIGTAASSATATAGVVLTGVAIAGIFPTVLAVAGAEFKEHSGTVFGLLFTVALAGGMTMPWLAGHLADWAGLRWVFALAAVNFLAIAALTARSRRARTA